MLSNFTVIDPRLHSSIFLMYSLKDIKIKLNTRFPHNTTKYDIKLELLWIRENKYCQNFLISLSISYKVTQRKWYDWVCSLHQSNAWKFCIIFFSQTIYIQLFFSNYIHTTLFLKLYTYNSFSQTIYRQLFFNKYLLSGNRK